MGDKHQNLWAPWRMAYIDSLSEKPESSGCFFCEYLSQPQNDSTQHVVLRSEHGFVLMNRYPYTNGHLMVAVNRHVGDPAELSEDELIDVTRLVYQSVALLKRVLNPNGFNLGANLGHCAGAGVPGHLHHHIVPRWSGDTNFMSTIAGARVIPQSLDELYQELVAAAQGAGQSEKAASAEGRPE